MSNIMREKYDWKQNWWFFVLLVFIFIFYQQLGRIYPDKAVTIGIGILFAFSFIRLIPDYFKVRSPKLVTNPFYDTTTGDKLTAGDYTIYRLGGVRTWVVSREGNAGTVVILKEGDNPVGINRALTPKCEMVSLAELPSEAIRVIKEHNLSPPYYLGLADEEQYNELLKDQDGRETLVGSKVNLIRIENAINRAYDSILRNDATSIQDTLKMIRRIQGIAEPETKEKDALRKIFIKEDEY